MSVMVKITESASLARSLLCSKFEKDWVQMSVLVKVCKVAINGCLLRPKFEKGASLAGCLLWSKFEKRGIPCRMSVMVKV